MEGELSSQRIDDSERGERGCVFLEENGKMHGLKEKDPPCWSNHHGFCPPAKTSARMVWCLPWKILDLETMRFIDSFGELFSDH